MLRKKKKLSAYVRVLRKRWEDLKELLSLREKALQRLIAETDSKDRRITELETQLQEARRRTIPLGDGSELNFLPVLVERVEIKPEMRELRTWSEPLLRHYATGNVRATIICSGPVVHYPKPVKP